MSIAEEAFLSAKDAGGEDISPKEFRLAELSYLKAKSAYKKKFFDKASQYAKISIKYSEMAELNAFKARALGVENRSRRILYSISSDFSFLLTSCLKTAAEIQREQEFEQALVSARESSSIISEITAKNKELQEQMSALQGRIDEVQLKVNSTGAMTANNSQST